MMNLELIGQQMDNGRIAKELQENPIFAGVFTAEKARIFSEFSRSKWYQHRLRQSLWAQIKAVNEIEDKIQRAVNVGLLAEEELKRQQKGRK
jgi:hypothetical protein